MSSIRINHASFGTLSGGDTYTHDTVTGLGLVACNSNTTKPAVFNLLSKNEGYSDTTFSIFGNHVTNYTDTERLSLGYNLTKTTYEIHTSAAGNGASRSIVFSTHGNSDQLKIHTNGSVLFPQTTDASSTQSGSVVFNGGVGVNLSIWGRTLSTVEGISVGGVLDVSSTADSVGVGTGSGRFAGGIYAGKSLVLGNVVQNRRVVMWSDVASGGVDDFIGFGVDTNGVGAAKSLHVQIPGISSQFALFRGSIGGPAGELFRITGDGKSKLFGAVDMNNFQIKSVADPSDAFDAVNKGYVDRYVEETINNYDPKESVHVATDSAVTLATSIVPGQLVDDVVLNIGSRVLVKTQTNPVENGVYVVQATGSPVRAEDMNTNSMVAGSFFFVESGTKYAHMGFLCSNSSGADVVGTDALSFVQFSGLGQISGGAGISKQDNIISTSTDQSHVTKLGEITTGEWKSNSIKVAYGGTGVGHVDTGLILYGNGATGSALKSNPAFLFDETDLSLKVQGPVYVGRPLSDVSNYLAFSGLAGNGVVSASALNSVIIERHSLSGTLTPTQQSVTELVIFKGSEGTGSTQDDIRVIAGGSIHLETLPPSGASSYNAITDSFTGGSSNQPIKRLSLNSSALDIAQGVVVTVKDSLYVHGETSVTGDVLLGGAVRYTATNIHTIATGNEYAINNVDTSIAEFRVSVQKHPTAGPRVVSMCVYGTGASSAANSEGISLTSDGSLGVHFLKTLQSGTGTPRPVVLMTGTNANQIRLEIDGSVKYSSSINASGLTTAAAVFSGGISVGLDTRIGGKLYIGSTFRASSIVSEMHELTASHLLSAVLVIANKNAAGNSVIGFDDPNGVRQLSIGYSADGTGSRIISTGNLQLGGNTFINTDGSVSLSHTLDSNASDNAATLSIPSGGLYVNKTVTAASLYTKSGGITTVSSLAAGHHVLRTTTGALKRWMISLVGAESGSNSGSNYTFSASDDTGASDWEIAKLYRSDKHVELYGTMPATGPGTGALRVSGGVYTGSDSYFTGSLVLGGPLITKSVDATTTANLVLQNEMLQTGWSVMVVTGDSNSLHFRRHTPTTGAYLDSPLILRNDSADVRLSGRLIHTNTTTGPPTLGARSIGTRIVLSADVAAGRSEYAFGVGTNDLWMSVPSSTQTMSFYAGNHRVFQLSGSGQVASRSGKAVYNVDALDVGTQATLFTRYQSENDTGLGDVVAGAMTVTVVLTLTSQAAASNMYSVVLPASASSVDGKYIGWYIKVRTGSAASQVRRIVSYTGSTKIAEFSVVSVWTSTRPGSGDIIDMFENALGAVSYSSIRNEFILASSATSSLGEIAYCDLRANRISAADGFIYAGYAHPSDNLANSPKSSGDRGFVMKRWQTPNDTSLGDVISHGTADFTDTLPSQAGRTTSELLLSPVASSTSDAYANWWVIITSGANSGQVRKIASYDGTLRIAKLESTWTSQSPATGSTCSLFAKNDAAIYFDETANKITTAFTTSPPLSSASGGSLVSVGLADVRVGSLDATGVFNMTGSVGVSSTLTIGPSGLVRTDAGSSAAGGASVHHTFRDNAGTSLFALGLAGTVASGNNGGDYSISRYDNAGVYVDMPMQIKRSTGNVTINTTSRIQSTGTGAMNIAGDMTLTNTTSNMIMLANASNLGAPTYATRSLGTKLVFHTLLGAFSADFALGMENQALWTSVPSDTHKFKWYSGTTEIASLNSAGLVVGNGGDVTVSGYLDAGSSGALMTRAKQFPVLTMPMVDTQTLQIPHGVSGSKIVSVTCVITALMSGTTVYIPPNRNLEGYMYSVLWTDSNIFVIPLTGNAVNLLGCAASVSLTYQK